MTLDQLKAQLAEAATALQRGDRTKAAQICAAILATKSDEPNALHLLGLIRTQEGRLVEGIALLERARTAQPKNIQLLNNLGIAYRRLGRTRDARDVLRSAVALDPRFAPAQYNLGNALTDLDDVAAARSAFEAATLAKPDYADAHAGIAKLAEMSHDLAAARSSAQKVLALDPMHPVANLTLARIDMREGHAADALARLRPLVDRTDIAWTNRVIAHGLAGQSLDRLGRHAEAFASFESANALQNQHTAGRVSSPSIMSLKTVQHLTDVVDRSDASVWETSETTEKAPVFFVGFPRSGTTLVEQILASHPAIATMEEKDVLAESIASPSGSADWLSEFISLTPPELAQRRATYWRSADRYIKGNREGLIVDKLPLNTILLAPAHRLFPTAKIIFALRDPRDVVLSCFQQTFDMNAAMFEFLTLETAARYYDAAMRLFKVTRAKLPLTLHTIRYEDLLSDFEGETRRLLQFLEIPWNESVRNYRDTAKKRLINTPSASQVVTPLYTSARGKWRNYRAQLEPVLPLLEPWAQAFGYEPA